MLKLINDDGTERVLSDAEREWCDNLRGLYELPDPERFDAVSEALDRRRLLIGNGIITKELSPEFFDD
jgi:hypothetical protein